MLVYEVLVVVLYMLCNIFWLKSTKLVYHQVVTEIRLLIITQYKWKVKLLKLNIKILYTQIISYQMKKNTHKMSRIQLGTLESFFDLFIRINKLTNWLKRKKLICYQFVSTVCWCELRVCGNDFFTSITETGSWLAAITKPEFFRFCNWNCLQKLELTSNFSIISWKT